jgi:hypothetical protein
VTAAMAPKGKRGEKRRQNQKKAEDDDRLNPRTCQVPTRQRLIKREGVVKKEQAGKSGKSNKKFSPFYAFQLFNINS